MDYIRLPLESLQCLDDSAAEEDESFIVIHELFLGERIGIKSVS